MLTSGFPKGPLSPNSVEACCSSQFSDAQMFTFALFAASGMSWRECGI